MSKKTKAEIDSLSFDFELISADSTLPIVEDGVYITGLYIEGAKWETFKLDELDNGVAQKLPTILCRARPPKQLQTASKLEFFQCPVYRSAERGQANYVTSIRLPSAYPEKHWVKRSVVLLTHADL